MRLKFRFKLLLTGTPLQNHLGELFSLLHFLDSVKFPSEEAFLETYGTLNDAEKVRTHIRTVCAVVLSS